MKALSLWHGVIDLTDTRKYGARPTGGAARFRQLAQRVAAEHEVRVSDIEGRSRIACCVRARQELMARAYATGNFSLPMLGRLMGRDHATVLWGIRAHNARSSHLLSDINTSSTSLNPPNPAGVTLVP